MKRFFIGLLLMIALPLSAAVAQYKEQLQSMLLYHTVVLNSFYIDANLTFGPDGKLTSGGTHGFGPTDGTVNITKVDLTPTELLLSGQRAMFVWNDQTARFTPASSGREVKIVIQLPEGVPPEKSVPRLLDRVLLDQKVSSQFKCADTDLKVQGGSRPWLPSLPTDKSAAMAVMCFPAGERAYPAYATVTAPKVKKSVDPVFPAAANYAVRTAMVRVAMIVDEDGRPSTIVVLQSAGSAFDQSAVTAVSNWKFQPGALNGRTIPVAIETPVYFRMLKALPFRPAR